MAQRTVRAQVTAGGHGPNRSALSSRRAADAPNLGQTVWSTTPQSTNARNRTGRRRVHTLRFPTPARTRAPPVPRAPSSCRVRRTPLRYEGRVEPGPMGHSALGNTSTRVETRRGSFGWQRVSPTRHHSVQDPFGRVLSGVVRRTVSTSIRSMAHTPVRRQADSAAARAAAWRRMAPSPRVTSPRAISPRARGTPRSASGRAVSAALAVAACARFARCVRSRTGAVPQARGPRVARQLIHFGTGPFVTANWPAQRHRRGRAAWRHRSTSRHRWTSQALRPISIGPAGTARTVSSSLAS
jgi:hypothetical protein